MGHVAVLGAGMLGAGFIQALRKREVPVRVWNRSPARAEALRTFGAEVAKSPAEAVAGAERVHVVLSDDAAVDDVLSSALPALQCVVIDHTTVSPAGVVARTERLAKTGHHYVHAPVFMGPANAQHATGLMLVSGPKDRIEPLMPVLGTMTGKVVHVGDRVDQAAAFKLFGNSVLFTLVAGASDVLAMARALGIDGQEAIGLFAQFDPTPVLRHRGMKMARSEWEPASFELSMARKDVRLMIEAAGQEGLLVLPAIAERMDELLALGFGREDLTALGRPALGRTDR
jgi:3-hydroxyisobutyrate dehydrogenase